MSLAYYTVQFVVDPVRGEGRNVAVIGTAGGRGYVRAVGLDREGRLDMAEFRAVSGLSMPESVIYPDWIEYFQCVAADNATTPERLARELSTLAPITGPFALGAAGEAEIDAREGPETAMDRVFERVVGRPPPNKVDRFPDRLEAFLQASELSAARDFWRDPEIELKMKAGVITLRFDFALVEAPAVGFLVVRYGAGNAATASNVRAALREFRKAWEAEFLSAGRSVVLTDREWPAGTLVDEAMRARVVVINLTAPDAQQRLASVLRRRSMGRRA